MHACGLNEWVDSEHPDTTDVVALAASVTSYMVLEQDHDSRLAVVRGVFAFLIKNDHVLPDATDLIRLNDILQRADATEGDVRDWFDDHFGE